MLMRLVSYVLDYKTLHEFPFNIKCIIAQSYCLDLDDGDLII